MSWSRVYNFSPTTLVVRMIKRSVLTTKVIPYTSPKVPSKRVGKVVHVSSVGTCVHWRDNVDNPNLKVNKVMKYTSLKMTTQSVLWRRIWIPEKSCKNCYTHKKFYTGLVQTSRRTQLTWQMSSPSKSGFQSQCLNIFQRTNPSTRSLWRPTPSDPEQLSIVRVLRSRPSHGPRPFL